MPRQYTRRHVIRVIGPSIAYVPLTKEMIALIDSCDADSVDAYTWSAMFDPSKDDFCGCTSFTHVVDKGATLLYLHIFLMGYKGGLTVDHANGKSLDNRRCNLRWANTNEQAINRKKNMRNTSGHTGIRVRSSGNHRVDITVNGVRINLGTYADYGEAVRVREEAEMLYFGAFRRVV